MFTESDSKVILAYSTITLIIESHLRLGQCDHKNQMIKLLRKRLHNTISI